MVSKGDRLNLNFPTEALRAGKRWQGEFADLLEGPTVVSVYMRNNTSSCDKQVASLVESSKAIAKLGYNLVAVSKDTLSSHCKYAVAQEASYTFVSDKDHLFGKAADSILEKQMYGKVFLGPSRSAYLVDAEGVVIDVIEKVEPARHGEQVVDAIKSIG